MRLRSEIVPEAFSENLPYSSWITVLSNGLGAEPR
jgi:hypothetical protein